MIKNMLQFAPILLEIKRGMGQVQPSPGVTPMMKETQDQLADFKKDVLARLEAMEVETARLKARLRETESALIFYKVFLWSFGAFSLVAFIMAAIVIVHMATK